MFSSFNNFSGTKIHNKNEILKQSPQKMSVTSLDGAIMPMYRAFEAGEVHLENLTLTSLDPHFSTHK